MREIPEAKPAQGGIGRRALALLTAVALGGFVGAIFFPTVETKFVEKRVEVPVEVVKYVDRIVEKRVEIPVEKIIYRQAEAEVDPLDRGHRMLLLGMRKSQVFTLVGRPYFDDGNGSLHYYSVSSRMNLRLRFNGDLLVEIIHPK